MTPLSGITVIDFSRVLAGPLATQILAELGAEVIKVERPGSGDESRGFEPKLPNGESAYFFAVNRGKRSVTLNLKSPGGQRVARDLVRGADVLIENFLPGAMVDMGLGYETLSADNPELVYVSSTGFGQHGPYAQRKGYDTVFQAMSGIMDLTGHPDTPPAKAGVPISDMTSAVWIVIGALTGLIGRGGHVDLAMMDVQLSLLALAAARVFALDEEPTRCGTEHPGRVPSAAFECADRSWLHISASDPHWQPLCTAMGLYDLANDRRFDTNRGRVEHRGEVMTRLRGAIALRERTELAVALRDAGVPVGEVNTVREALTDNNVLARGIVSDFEHPLEGRFPALRTPLRYGGVSPQPQVPPLLGDATEQVLSDRLGLTPEQIGTLRSEGAI